MSFSPSARPTLDLLESRDVATIGLLGGLFHGVSLFDCKPEPVKPCVPVSMPKCDIKVELPKCDIKVTPPKCEPPKQDKCEPVKPPVTPPKCEPKKDDCTPKAPPVVCQPKKDDCAPKKDDCGPKAPPTACEPKKDDKKCDDKKDDKKDCFTPADLVHKIVTAKVQVVKKFSFFGKC